MGLQPTRCELCSVIGFICSFWNDSGATVHLGDPEEKGQTSLFTRTV